MIVLPFMLTDVAERYHDTGDDVGDGAVGPYPHDVGRALVPQVELMLDDLQGALNLPDVLAKLVIGKQGHDIGHRSAAIAVAQREYLPRCRREIPDAKLIIEKDGRDLRAVEKVLKVVVGLHQQVILAMQLVVDGLEFL